MGTVDGNADVANHEIVNSLDGALFKPMVSAALAWLRHHQETVNALNVFPVPDGDTGTNMTLTMTSAWEEIAELEESHLGRLVNKVAHGALMGARGNSGVILSQIWRGFAHGLADYAQVAAGELSDALSLASETAYKGVVKPVEGTILTVIREVAEESEVAAQEAPDLLSFWARLVNRARVSVERTPTLLPVLRQAGVVDAGGQGLLVILEGMYRYLDGRPTSGSGVPTEVMFEEAVAGLHSEQEALEFDSRYPYDVQFIIVGQDMDISQVRSHIESLGDCPLTVGDDNTIKVHVHVADPGAPLSYAAQWGALRDVVVEDMEDQYRAFSAGRVESAALESAALSSAALRESVLRSPSGVPIASLLAEEEPLQICVVVVSAGEGLKNVFLSLGATVIVEGGQTMNPSTAQLLEAIEHVPSDQVILLPNNKNIWMAAEQAAEVSTKDVAVVPTRTLPQGVSALLALDQDATLASNAMAMTESAKEVITGEVTWATRDVELNGIQVREGDAIGLLDDDLVVDTPSFEEAVRWLLAEAELEMRELVTLYYGESVTGEQAQALAETLGAEYPDLEFEVVEGGQPHYPYIISIE